MATTQTAAERSSSTRQRGEIWKPRSDKSLVDREHLVSHLLEIRGIAKEDQLKFLDPSYDELRSRDSQKLVDIEKAATVILKTIGRQSGPIVIFGDYDVDGICGTALLDEALKKVGGKTVLQLPHRERDGYGLQLPAVPGIIKQHPSLVITVDNGSSSAPAIQELKTAGLQVIVVDHHEIPAEAPEPYAFCNPKRKDEKSSFRMQCATGVAFRLAEELYRQAGIADGQEKWLLDLVALATVCDMMPLKDENRAFVQFGLKTLANTRRAGLRALLEVSGLSLDQVNAESIGFGIGPRLNAAGRLEHAEQALHVVTETDQNTALQLARKLDQINQRRKNETQAVVRSAKKAALEYSNAVSLVLSHPEWPRGVCGLAAGRLARDLNKPVFILEEGELCVGSGRSAGDVNLAEMLQSHSGLFEKAGGHAAAAGCTIKHKNIAAFREHLEQFVTDKRGPRPVAKEHEYDVPIPLSIVNADLLDDLQKLAPYGQGNPEPVFLLENCRVAQTRAVGSEEQHLSFRLEQDANNVRGIAFFKAKELDWMQPGVAMDALVTVKENIWQNVRNAELHLIDARKR